MTTVLIVVHLMVVLAMIGLVLLQRSEGGALGIGGGSGAFLSGRGAGNVLTRTTGILALAFFATSLGLALLSRMESRPSDILDRIGGDAAPVTAPAAPLPAGAPTSAQDVLQGLGGAGPQTPPAADGAAPGPAEDATPPAPAPPAAPASGAPASGAQTPPPAPQ